MITTKSNSHKPSKKSVESLANKIEATQSLHYVMFADIFIRFVEITLKKTDLSRLQGVALHNLVRNGGSLTPTELAKATYRSKHSMTKIIDTLEEKGLVTRNGSQEDRRSTPIQLTLEGATCVKQDIQQGDIWIQKATDVLNDTEKEMFVNMVDRVYKRISEIIDDMESNNR